MTTAQDGFAWRFDWGDDGLHDLAPAADAVVLVDILRFTSAVSVALEHGVEVVPAAGPLQGRPGGSWQLSARWIAEHPPGTRLTLASANGGALAVRASEAGVPLVVAGCLRNASAVAAAVRDRGAGVVAVVAAGEQRRPDGPARVRFSVEDLVGAGAVLAALDPAAAVSAPRCSPEAAAARAAFLAARPRLTEVIAATASGRELGAAGRNDDVAEAALLDVTRVVPVLRDGVFVAL